MTDCNRELTTVFEEMSIVAADKAKYEEDDAARVYLDIEFDRLYQAAQNIFKRYHKKF